VLSLLNVVCRDLGRELRFCELPCDEPADACILWAPKTAIERAVAEGVIILFARKSRT